jgi:cytochrome c oxidase cbb3-type subunit III
MRPGRGTLPMLAVLLAAVLVAWGIGCRKGSSPGHEGVPPGSSFAAVTLQQGRSPLDLSLTTGKAVYDHYCAICHGETGGGDGFNSYNVKETYGVKPTAFADSTETASLKDSEALTAIRKGGLAVGKSAAMPPWGHTLTPGEVADVWQYARSLTEAAHQP